MRKLLAIWTAKLVSQALGLCGRTASALPGRIALIICPDILQHLSQKIPRENIFAICGTNGKTTTTNFLFSMLTAGGEKAVCNNAGANMLVGIVTAFIQSTDVLGRTNGEYAVLEIDEATAVKVFPFIQPKYMIITNFFRDQMDRYGEVDMTMKALKKGVDLVPDMELIVNCDDPLVQWFAKGRRVHTYGISEEVFTVYDDAVNDGKFCKICGNALEYKYRHYSQLGCYYCDTCGFARPEPDYSAAQVRLENGISFTVGKEQFHVNLRGFYNIYNILAAYTGAAIAGIDKKNIQKSLNSFIPQNGRMEQFNIDGKTVILNLSKNPAGFNQAISTLLEDSRSKDIIFVINDNAGDGRDVSWLWDVDFENASDVNTFGLSGIRHDDLMLRFKYGNFDMTKVQDYKSADAAVDALLKSPSQILCIFANYTALFPVRDRLKKLAGEDSR